jgi:hypothetical protein
MVKLLCQTYSPLVLRVKLYCETVYYTRGFRIEFSAVELSRISRDLPINSPINARMITRAAPDRIVFS